MIKEMISYLGHLKNLLLLLFYNILVHLLSNDLNVSGGRHVGWMKGGKEGRKKGREKKEGKGRKERRKEGRKGKLRNIIKYYYISRWNIVWLYLY